jgi:hypothetical protein
MMGEKRFIWELNLYRIFDVLANVISSATKELRA